MIPLLVLTLVNAFYVAALPSATVFYVIKALVHIVLGAAATAILMRRFGRNKLTVPLVAAVAERGETLVWRHAAISREVEASLQLPPPSMTEDACWRLPVVSKKGSSGASCAGRCGPTLAAAQVRFSRPFRQATPVLWRSPCLSFENDSFRVPTTIESGVARRTLTPGPTGNSTAIGTAVSPELTSASFVLLGSSHRCS
jgi:hypothetical protein